MFRALHDPPIDFRFPLDGNLVLYPLVSRGVENNDARVHAGFLISYNSVRSVVLRTVRAQLEAFPGYVVVLAGKCLRMIDYSFFFSNWTGLGHSMGGALASLAAISVKSNIPWAAVRLFTFGACFFFLIRSGRRLYST